MGSCAAALLPTPEVVPCQPMSSSNYLLPLSPALAAPPGAPPPTVQLTRGVLFVDVRRAAGLPAGDWFSGDMQVRPLMRGAFVIVRSRVSRRPTTSRMQARVSAALASARAHKPLGSAPLRCAAPRRLCAARRAGLLPGVCRGPAALDGGPRRHEGPRVERHPRVLQHPGGGSEGWLPIVVLYVCVASELRSLQAAALSRGLRSAA